MGCSHFAKLSSDMTISLLFKIDFIVFTALSASPLPRTIPRTINNVKFGLLAYSQGKLWFIECV